LDIVKLRLLLTEPCHRSVLQNGHLACRLSTRWRDATTHTDSAILAPVNREARNPVTWRSTRVVFQDIDGCLNTPGVAFPDGAGGIASPEQARLLGEIGRAMDASRVTDVVLNTGRGLAAMDFIVDGLASQKVRYLLAEHGAVAFDVTSGCPIDLHAIALRTGHPERTARYAQLVPIRSAIAWYDAIGEAQLSALFGCPLPALPKTANLTLMIPPGIRSSDVAGALARAIESSDEVDSEDFIYHSSSLYVDVLGQVSKGDGAILLLDELGIPPSQAMAMGDGTNDISMFEVLGFGYCPTNAADELKGLCEQRAGVVSARHSGEAARELYRELAPG
jgi:hydroxymethylpyrimidine pyrophosphatase-like HAD family hydrolase